MDPYFKKEIKYRCFNENFTFEVGNTLFSTYDMDHGTDCLLRAMTFDKPHTILDIGCGYGPIGIILAKKHPRASVTMLDKDLLAVRYSKINAEKNNIRNVEILGSVGTETVADRMFDLIVSNVPAKIGDDAITSEFILAPYSLLNSGGNLWLVVVAGLNHLIPRVGRQHDLNMKEVKKRNGHSVYLISKK
ncbi:MAG: class I SAM-dependent methyltransferase [bacterium]|nr:class I SAM-dependent methyltransferase [bacterium]